MKKGNKQRLTLLLQADIKSLGERIHSTMYMPKRSVYRCFHIDTNRINSKNSIQNMNRLQQWHSDGVIRIDISQVAQNEAVSGNNAARKEKAHGYIFSMTLAKNPNEESQISDIGRILFPDGAKTDNQRNDVLIVFNALKYSCILVTNDGGSRSQPGGILGNADKLVELGVTVMRDNEAVVSVERLIMERDNLAREMSAFTGNPLPEWMGKD